MLPGTETQFKTTDFHPGLRLSLAPVCFLHPLSSCPLCPTLPGHPLVPLSLHPHPRASLLGRWQLVTVLLLMFFSCCDSLSLSCEEGYWVLKHFKGKERLEMKFKKWIPSRSSGILCPGRLIILWDDCRLWLAGGKGWFRPCPRLSADNISGWIIKWTRAAGDHPACQFILLRKDLGPVLDHVPHEHMLFIY